MKVSIYSTCWGLKERPESFDIVDALSNWSLYADQISIACGDDYSYDAIDKVANERGFPVTLTRTTFDFKTNGLAYGQTENAALQACDGQLLIQQNNDERIKLDKNKLEIFYEILQSNPQYGSFFIPTIDLYGSLDRYSEWKKKWYIHREGLFRGPVNFAFKKDGKLDYNKSSSDELISRDGNLLPTIDLFKGQTIEDLRAYVADGMPIIYHLGYVSYEKRLQKSLWWKEFWTRTTLDENKHPTSVEEIAARETKLHGLPLWEGRG